MNKSKTEYNAFMLNDLDKKILQVILSSDTPVAGNQLASFCNVSVNTIRSEIDAINAYIIPHGCRIDSKVSIGYSLGILDNSLADQFLSQLIIEASRYTYMNLTIFARAYFIVRTLLVSTVPISIDNLADQMFCSKSTVLRNLPAAKKYIEVYDLSLKECRNSGLYIDGSEWNKRICLLAQHKIYSNTPADLKGDESEFCGQLLMHSNFRKPIENKQFHFECANTRYNFSM